VEDADAASLEEAVAEEAMAEAAAGEPGVDEEAVVEEGVAEEAVAEEAVAEDAAVEETLSETGEGVAVEEGEPETVSYGAEEEVPETRPLRGRRRRGEDEEEAVRPPRQRSRLVPFLVGGVLFGLAGVSLWAIGLPRPAPIAAIGNMAGVAEKSGDQKGDGKKN